MCYDSGMKEKNEAITQKWPNRLVLVRHGESRYNAERELVERGILKTYTDGMKNMRNADIPLSKKGIMQARKTGLFLKKQYKDFDVVFVSPFKRASETGAIIARNFPKVKVLVDERIREKEFGIADSMTTEELQALFPYEFERKRKEGKYYYRPIGGESYPDVNLRIWAFLTMIVREYPQARVLVVSHSAVMRAFRKNLEKLSEAQMFALDGKNELKNCAIISYEYNPRLKPKPKLQLKYYNKIVWK